jgi:hypothetical protein
MKTSVEVVTTLVLFFLSTSDMSYAQRTAENPWNGWKPNQAEHLAWDRYYIEGFAWPTSVRSGEQVTVYVSVQDTHAANRNYEVRVYRIPDTMHQKNPYTVLQAQYIPLHDSLNQLIHYYDSTHTRKPVDYRTGCRTTWAGSTVTIQTSGWQSGLYYARLMSQSHPEKIYNVPFVVRAATPGLTSKILFKFSYNTLQAYNWWGGGSLYSPTQDPNSLTTTNLVAMDRPLESGWSTAFHHPFLGTWHGVFANLLDSLGYQMEYCNNIDLDGDSTDPPLGVNLLTNYNMLILFQHDEYWSFFERFHIEQFKGLNYHGNIASFSANTCYWQVNWDSSSDYSKMYCGKWQGVPSTKWRELVPPNPESKLLGEQYQYGGNALYADSTVEEPPMKARNLQHWIYRGVSFPADSLIGKGWFGITPSGRREEHGIAAQELDNTLTGPAPYPLDTLASRYVWSRGIGTCDSCHGYILHEMTYYEDTVSNARVLAAGGTNWENGLFTFNPVDGTGADRLRMKTITQNIIDHFSGKKYIGKVWTIFESRLIWRDSVELDGNVEIPPDKYLVSENNVITVDSTFAINGTLEINGSVTIAGSGHINVGATGEIKLMPGATLTVKCKLITAPNYELNIPVNTTLRIEQQPGELLLGENSLVVVDGALIVNGTAQSRVTITSADAGEIWAGITSGASPPTISLSYANISNATTAINAGHFTTLTVDNCIFSNCNIGISIFPTAHSPIPTMQITNNTFSNNTYAVICDMSNANLGYDYGGNSICYNSAVDVWIDGGSKVFARNDSWVSNGCDPENPPGTLWITSGSIDFEPCAGSCGGQNPIVVDTNGKILEGGDSMMTRLKTLLGVAMLPSTLCVRSARTPKLHHTR